MNLNKLQGEAFELLRKLIAVPSFSGEEDATANILEEWFRKNDISCQRHLNNVWVKNKFFDEKKPTLLLVSHHDTVRPNTGYTRNPFEPKFENGKLYGLGSNDAGGCLVSLLVTFTWFFAKENLSYNLVFAGTAEEEINGKKGISSLLKVIPPVEVAIVGEPTLMNLATAEKGLVVFDATIKGTPSHAAHKNCNNAIYKVAEALKWFQEYRFTRKSNQLGEVKLTVTQINGGSQHNVVPAEVDLVIDVRVNDRYSNVEVERILRKEAPVNELKARSLRLNSSSIPLGHDLVVAGFALGMKNYGSPTLSDQAMLSCPSLKLGPGDSTRSHSANEFIYVEEINEGIALYIKLLEKTIYKTT